jgi:hypothetical protein
MTSATVYEHIADFIADMNPQMILKLKAPEEMRNKLEYLLDKEKDEALTLEEKDDLDHYMILERLIRMAKTRARIKLK